ncbi:hypothetical protein [Lactococcus formosensis]|jgi:hypothetical protein|uniref:Lipoprotein n=1 Tax=Lactococcus formosensis TaxID=1281486 RepID=A0A9Q9D645_9LACT|nr:hypothetical protein [Lactococcus formosensis]USJ19823.1 hypothetical protein LMK00_08295 [Lactococcus formosensis]
MKRILFGIGLTGILIMGLAGCTKNNSTQLQSDENIESVNNPEFVAKRFLSWVYEGRSTDIEKIIGIDHSDFHDEQIEFFEERAGSVTPVVYPLVIKYDNFSEIYQPKEIKEDYAKAMVAYFEQIGSDYNVIRVEEEADGAEVTVETKGIALNALANQANRYMDSLIGFDQNMALSKYPSNQVQKANAVLQFWAMGQLYKQGNKAPMLDKKITYTLHLDKESNGEYKPTSDTLGEVYSGSKRDTYEDGE